MRHAEASRVTTTLPNEPAKSRSALKWRQRFHAVGCGCFIGCLSSTPHVELYIENMPDDSCDEAVSFEICFMDEAMVVLISCKAHVVMERHFPIY
jgi:hypothetical protein